MAQGKSSSTVSPRQTGKGMKAIAFAAAMVFSSFAGAQTLFDYVTDPLQGNPPTVSGYTPAPFVTDANAGAAAVYLTGQPVKAIKTQIPLSGGTIATLYGPPTSRPQYTFLDLESPSANADTTGQRNAINAATGGAVSSNSIYVGNFNFYPLLNDPTRPSAPVTTTYAASGLNMANEALYPGSPDLRSLPNGNSTAPNIRSSLFVLPIVRATLVTANLPTGHKHIPYVTRFNNNGNSAFDDDANPSNGYQWTAPSGQMLSRGDFKALVAHYRLRGADGVHVFESAVQGYTQTQQEQDAADGFNFTGLGSGPTAPANIFANGNAKIATIDTAVKVDGILKPMETAGVVFSGVYSLTQGTGTLALLVSNLDGFSHSLSVPAKIGGKSIGGSFAIAAGQHRLLEFTGAGTQWNLIANNPVFIDNNRDGVGVPEPTMVGGIVVLGALGMSRRRRQTA